MFIRKDVLKFAANLQENNKAILEKIQTGGGVEIKEFPGVN